MSKPIAPNPTPRRRPRPGFTLGEMLVVIGIILLVLAISLPAFTAIIGSRSNEAAQNIIAASLVRARTEAIRRGTPCGVFFFIDPATQQSALAVCVVDALGDPDPYDEYKSFSRGPSAPIAVVPQNQPFNGYQGGTFDPLNEFTVPPPPPEDEPAMTADRVAVLTADENGTRYSGNYAAFFGRPIVAVMQHSSGDLDGDPDNGLQNPGIRNGNMPSNGDGTVPGPNGGPVFPGNDSGSINSANPRSGDSALWGLSGTGGGTVELIDGLKVEILPAGVGVQVIRKQVLNSGTSDAAASYLTGGQFAERYTRAGLIAFAPDGQLLQTNWRIDSGSRLGRLIDLTTGSYAADFFGNDLESQIGVVLYEQDAFENAASDGTATNWKQEQGTTPAAVRTLQANDVVANFKTTDGDFMPRYPYPDLTLTDGKRPQTLAPSTTGEARDDEYAEERWLDANTIPLMVNRYSGVLVEAQ